MAVSPPCPQGRGGQERSANDSPRCGAMRRINLSLQGNLELEAIKILPGDLLSPFQSGDRCSKSASFENGRSSSGTTAGQVVAFRMDYFAADVIYPIRNIVSEVSVCPVDGDLDLANCFPLSGCRKERLHLLVGDNESPHRLGIQARV